jgi:hypothetical protein
MEEEERMTHSSRTRAPRRGSTLVGNLMTGFALCGAVFFMGWLGTVAAKPFLQARQMRAENATIEGRILALQMETQTLRKAVASVGLPQNMEREARRLGYLKPGEAPLVIP